MYTLHFFIFFFFLEVPRIFSVLKLAFNPPSDDGGAIQIGALKGQQQDLVA